MHFLRFIVSIIIILIIIFSASLLLPSKITISKGILINAPQTAINKEIQDFGNWKNWYPAFQNENVSVVKKSSKEGIINSVSLKDNKEKRLDLDLIESKSDTTVIAVESASSTKVNYQFILSANSNGQMLLIWNVNTFMGGYPWQRIKGIFLDKISGPQYEAALVNLKNAVEK